MNFVKIVFCVALSYCLISVSLAYECPDVWTGIKVFYDETCTSAPAGSGCNAGGKGQNCRFCGVDPFPNCPPATSPKPNFFSTCSRDCKCNCNGVLEEPTLQFTTKKPKYDCPTELTDTKIFYDETCETNGGPGCNAGGKGQNCRFCGKDDFPACPVATTPTPEVYICREGCKCDCGEDAVVTDETTTTTITITTSEELSTDTLPKSIDELLPENWKSEPNEKSRKHMEHPVGRPSIVDDTYTGPLPTNSWYQNLLVGTTEQTIQLHPYLVQAKADRLSVSASTIEQFVNNRDYVIQPFAEEWNLTVKGSTFTKKTIKNLNELSVLLHYTTSTGSIDIPLVQGVPFITAVYTTTTPVLETVRSIVTVKVNNGDSYGPGRDVKGTKFVLNLNSGVFWVLYTSSEVTLRVSANELFIVEDNGQQPGSYTIKLGMLGHTDTSDKLDVYRDSYVESADLSYEFKSDTGSLKYIWQKRGTGKVLMFALPHHTGYLKNVKQIGLRAHSIKGELVGIEGDLWTMEIPLSPVSWYATNEIDPSKIEDVRNALIKDSTLKTIATDCYWFGLEISRSARLALIADQLGETEIAKKVRQELKSSLVPWLEGKNLQKLKYDKIFGGIVSLAGTKNSEEDNGNGYYNEHHFHYGYTLYALAVVVKEEPEFYDKYKDEILIYVRTFGNPARDDPYFVFTRNKDWFAWHSWASGLFESPDNRNQESTSEAINSYYAISLLGKAIKNKYLDDFGRLMTAMEVVAMKKYWQMTSDSTIYPAPFSEKKMVGVVWSTKVEYKTLFGANHEWVHSMQLLPFTPMSEEYLDAKFIKEEKEFLDNNVKSAGEEWIGYLVQAKAVVDKENQWDIAKKIKVFYTGNTRTNMYYWIATR